MKKIAKFKKTAAGPRLSNQGKNVVIGSLLAVVAFCLASGCNVVSNMRLIRGLDVQFSQFKSSFNFVKYENLKMVEQYVSPDDFHCFERAAFTNSDSQLDRALKRVDQKRVAKLIHLITEANYDKDWSNGVDHLEAIQPKKRCYQSDRKDVSYRKANTCAFTLQVLSRLSARSQNTRAATRLLLSNLALTRQYISYARKNRGMKVIDVSILLSYAKGMEDTLKKTNNLSSFAGGHFPEVKERFEEFDKLFPLTKEAIKLERTNVRAFLDHYNEQASWSPFVPKARVNEKWLNKMLSYY